MASLTELGTIDSMPQFSIIITCHNQARFIGDAVSSALSQSFAAEEVIVVDDGSTDGSDRIVEKHTGLVRFIKLEKNIGANAARNSGAAAATGDYLVFLDGDDLLLPWALEMYARILERRHVSVMLSGLLWFEGEPPKKRFQDFPGKVEFVEYHALVMKDRSYRPSASATVIHRESFQRVKGWTNDVFPLEDLEMLIKLSCSDAIQIVSPPAVAYRVHANNSIHEVAPFVRELRRMIRKVNQSEYPCARLHRFASYAFIGGPALFWAKRAYRSGLYQGALRLLASGWAMILAAGIYRSQIMLKGRQPIESIPMPRGQNA